MPCIKIETFIKADIETCFDLARNIDFHQESLKHSGEIAIAGITSGLIDLGETVTWEAKHLGFVQHLTSKITELESPNYFVDEMVTGAFKSFRHEHRLEQSSKENHVIMTDLFYFESPLGPLGKVANEVFLKKYMTKLLTLRNQHLKEKAESLM